MRTWDHPLLITGSACFIVAIITLYSAAANVPPAVHGWLRDGRLPSGIVAFGLAVFALVEAWRLRMRYPSHDTSEAVKGISPDIEMEITKIRVNNQEAKDALIAASRTIHDYRELDTDVTMLNAIAHLYHNPDLIEVDNEPVHYLYYSVKEPVLEEGSEIVTVVFVLDTRFALYYPVSTVVIDIVDQPYAIMTDGTPLTLCMTQEAYRQLQTSRRIRGAISLKGCSTVQWLKPKEVFP